MLKPHQLLILVLIGILCVFFRVYNLNWGAPLYFHPDERNIASSVSKISFPSQMNPHFFAYGSLPIYTIYFTGIVTNCLTQLATLNPHSSLSHVSFEQAILMSRFYSALFATLLIPLLFVIGRKLSYYCHPEFISGSYEMPKQVRHDKKAQRAGLLAAFLGATSVGFIQFAHFGTFEMWLTFFTTLLFWLCIKKFDNTAILFIGIILGILVSTKISSLILLFIPLVVIPAKAGIHRSRIKYGMTKTIVVTIVKLLLSFSIVILIYVLTNPYVFLDSQAFQSSMQYETSVVLGTLPVFYTGEFFGTTPIIFQFLHSYPFLLNPIVTILFIPSFAYLIFKTIKTRNLSYLLLTSYFVILFFSQAFLFAKWTRYLVPTLPFVYLIIAIAIGDVIARRNDEAISLFKRLPRPQFTLSKVEGLAMTVFIFINIIFSFSYFITAFIEPDTRMQAKDFAQKNIRPNAHILSEIYDLGITPFNNSFPNITLFNFYDLDNNSLEYNNRTLATALTTTDYIILPSQRILKTRLLNPQKFPQGHRFYQDLINGKLGFKKIYETPCDIFCQITYLGNPVFAFEETVNVFDRPTVYIFKKL